MHVMTIVASGMPSIICVFLLVILGAAVTAYALLVILLRAVAFVD